MRLGAPLWLFFALLSATVIVGGAMAWAAWQRRRAIARFGDVALVHKLRDGSPAGWRAARGALVLVAVALLAVAGARPQHGSRTEVVSRRGIDVVVCLDVSKSMLARDVQPSRIERAKAELVRLLDEEPGDRIAVVLFAGDTMEYPLTTELPFDSPEYIACLAAFYDDWAQQLATLAQAEDVLVLCEGDPFFYGSFMHLYTCLLYTSPSPRD